MADDSGVVVDLAAEAPAEEARRPEEPAARGVLKTKAFRRSSAAVLAAALEGMMAPPVCLSSGASWPAVSGDGDGDGDGCWCMVTNACHVSAIAAYRINRIASRYRIGYNCTANE